MCILLFVKTTTNYIVLLNICILYFLKHFSFFLIMTPSNFFKNHLIIFYQYTFTNPRDMFQLIFWVRNQVLKTVQAFTSDNLRVMILIRQKVKIYMYNQLDQLLIITLALIFLQLKKRKRLSKNLIKNSYCWHTCCYPRIIIFISQKAKTGMYNWLDHLFPQHYLFCH